MEEEEEDIQECDNLGRQEDATEYGPEKTGEFPYNYGNRENPSNPTLIRVTQFQARSGNSDKFYRDLRTESNPRVKVVRYPWVEHARSMTLMQCTDPRYYAAHEEEDSFLGVDTRVPLNYNECIASIFELSAMEHDLEWKKKDAIPKEVQEIMAYNQQCLEEEQAGVKAGKMFVVDDYALTGGAHHHLKCKGGCQFALSAREAGAIVLRLQYHEALLRTSVMWTKTKAPEEVKEQIGVCHGVRHTVVQENMRPFEDDIVVDMGVGQGGYMDHYQTSHYYGVEEDVAFCMEAKNRAREQMRNEARILERNRVDDRQKIFALTTEIPDKRIDVAYFTYSIADYMDKKKESFKHVMSRMGQDSRIVVLMADTAIPEGTEAMIGPAYVRNRGGVNHVKFGSSFSKKKTEKPLNTAEVSRLMCDYGYAESIKMTFFEFLKAVPAKKKKGLSAYYGVSFTPKEWMKELYYIIYTRKNFSYPGPRLYYCVDCGEKVSKAHLRGYGHRGVVSPVCCSQVRFCIRCLVFECKCVGTCHWKCKHTAVDCGICGQDHCPRCSACTLGKAVPFLATKHIRGLEEGADWNREKRKEIFGYEIP